MRRHQPTGQHSHTARDEAVRGPLDWRLLVLTTLGLLGALHLLGVIG